MLEEMINNRMLKNAQEIKIAKHSARKIRLLLHVTMLSLHIKH